MPLANYWNFIKSLRSHHSRPRAVRRSDQAFQRQAVIGAAAEFLEDRVVLSALPALSITPTLTVAEGNSDTTDAVFTVTLSAASSVPVTVNYSTIDDTATSDSDYEANAGTLTFAPGETSKTITVKVDGDTDYESDEDFYVGIYGQVNAKIRNGDAVATGKITNDDSAPTASIGTPTIVYEGNSGTRAINFPVTLTGASDRSITVHYTTADGTATVADSDYSAKSGNITFAPGETTKNISIAINGDTKVESDETFNVTISAPSASSPPVITNATATGTIGDDDTLPVVSANDPIAIDEGNTGNSTLLYTITLSSASTQTVTVAYTTADGTAMIADSDYVAASGTLTFAPGELTKTIPVTVKGDTKNEANETILLKLSNATNAKASVASGTATITNDDITLPSISVGTGLTVTEGNGGTTDATFHLILSQASGQTITVAVATADGTGTLADNDYAQAAGTVTFAPGETDKTFVVHVNGDTKPEGNETFFIVLSDATNANIATESRSATITNDDSGVVSITKTTDGAETTPPTKGKFTVTQSGVSSADTVVTYTVTGTATPGDGHDYQTLSGTVTIPAGQTSATIDVNTLNDVEDEDNETVIVTLTGFTSHDATISLDPNSANLTATVNIVDASDALGLTVGGPAVSFSKKDHPVNVLPAATVNAPSLTGGTLSITIDAAGRGKRLFDKISFPVTNTLGTTTGAHVVNGQLTLNIDLSQGATAASVQAFLRGITFATKGKGLQTATRTLEVTLTDAGSHTSSISQTINVHSGHAV